MAFNINFNNTDYTEAEGYNFFFGGGWHGVEARPSTQNLPGQDGGVVNSVYRGMRQIVLNARFTGYSSEDQYWAMAATLVSEFIADGTSKVLKITRWGTEVTKQINCYVVQEPLINERPGENTFADFQVVLMAEDPNWQGSTLNSTTINLAESTGYDIPHDFPYDIGTATGTDVATLTNNGNTISYPSFTITAKASLTNPTVTNQTTGESFQINTTLLTDQVVTVQRVNSETVVLLNGVTNYFSNLIGDIFSLQVGNNSVRFTASTFDANSNVNITYRDSFVSI